MFILLLFQELNKDELTQHHTPSLKLGCSVVTVRQKFVTEIGKGCSLPFFTENRREQAWTPGGTRGARDVSTGEARCYCKGPCSPEALRS